MRANLPIPMNVHGTSMKKLSASGGDPDPAGAPDPRYSRLALHVLTTGLSPDPLKYNVWLRPWLHCFICLSGTQRVRRTCAAKRFIDI